VATVNFEPELQDLCQMKKKRVAVNVIFFSVEGKCELSPYKPVKTASEIKTNLQKIVSYCERKIGMAEIKKKWLESDLKKLEDLNQKSAEEKRTKDNKVKILNAQISKLQSEIASLQRQILHKNKLIRDITQRIITAGWNIAAANNRVNSLTASIRSKQAHIDALNRRIAKERAKRSPNLILACGMFVRRNNKDSKDGIIIPAWNVLLSLVALQCNSRTGKGGRNFARNVKNVSDESVEVWRKELLGFEEDGE